MEMRNYSIPEEIISVIMKYKKLKILMFENIQMNKDFLKYSKNNQKNKDKIYNNINNMLIPIKKLNYNLIQSNKNNFIQNPEYSFFKTKRESFRNENILFSLRKLGIEINEKEVYEEKTSNENKNLKKENKAYDSNF
mgnify:CR=1 FL=1